MIIGRQLVNEYYEDEKLYSTGDDYLDEMLEKAFCEGYEYAQKEFATQLIPGGMGNIHTTIGTLPRTSNPMKPMKPVFKAQSVSSFKKLLNGPSRASMNRRIYGPVSKKPTHF